jgi:hypothetical protein
MRTVSFKNIPVLSILSPVLTNGLIIGAELAYVLAPTFSLVFIAIFGFEVALGEAIAVIVIGYPLLQWFKKSNLFN